jgi:hypothetical protein
VREAIFREVAGAGGSGGADGPAHIASEYRHLIAHAIGTVLLIIALLAAAWGFMAGA